MIPSVNNLMIKRAVASDVALLQELSIVTFTDTYAAHNSPENIQIYIDKYFNTETLLQELNSNENFFFIAVLDDVPAGYIKLRTPFEQHASLKNKKNIELERIYVKKNLHGTGLGYKLIQHGIEFADSESYDVLWLGVWNQNEKAIKFYEKCGFEIFGEHKFILGTEEQIDYLMKKELTNQPRFL
jgi:ribosomal protein S18 acetylase RimI-like enzyme